VAVEGHSLQDLIRGRRLGTLLDRDEQMAQYRNNLGLPLEDQRRRFLFSIHGEAGVGKTYLTKQLWQIARDSGALTAYTDEKIEDLTSVMSAIADEFRRRGTRLTEFEKRAAVYKKRRRELESDSDVPYGLASFLARATVTTELHAGRDAPVAAARLLVPLEAAALADQLGQARTAYLARKFSDVDARLLLSPADELTPLFVNGLARVTAGRPIALFFDTFERTAPLLDRWLRDLYAGLYGNLPATLVTTIAGQQPLNPSLWGEYLPVITDIPLKPFSEAEARQFLVNKNVTDEQTTQVILSLSELLPIWITTLADAGPEDPSDIGAPAGDAVGRFLEWQNDPTRRTVAVNAALPRALNQDLLAAIAPSDKVSQLFGWLRGLPFVTRDTGSWRYHEVVRSAMLRLKRIQSPSEWLSDQIALSEVYNIRAANALGRNEKAWTNTEWTDNTREEIYHLLCADPVNNLPRALMSAVKAAEHSTVLARQWAELFADAGRDVDSAVLRGWGQLLRNAIRGDDASEYLSWLINDAHLYKTTMTVALEERGEAHRLNGHYDQALADFKRALELDPERAWTICRRGLIYQAIGRYDDALADFNSALELDPENAWASGSRGLAYQAMGRYEDALADFNHTIQLDPGDAEAIGQRGETYRRMGRNDDALADFTRALELYPRDHDVLCERGLTYLAMSRYDYALSDLNDAIELDPDDPWSIASRGQAYQAMGRFEEALADFSRAVELKPDDGWTMSRRGHLQEAMGRFEEAVADFSRAVELDPGAAGPIASRGQAYQAMGCYEEAVADFTRAVELDPDDAEAICRRGETYQLLGRYEEALADFSRALELDPGDAEAIGQRGETYRLLGCYEEAVADFTRAVELDPGDAEAIGQRGETYRLQGRYDEALADFTRALELDPCAVAAIISRGQAYEAMGRYDDALVEFSRALRLDPGDAQAIIRRGQVYQTMGRHDDALADITRALRLDPSLSDIIGRHTAREAVYGLPDPDAGRDARPAARPPP
jgi:tetratricopeptide (TPR) repeat protein